MVTQKVLFDGENLIVINHIFTIFFYGILPDKNKKIGAWKKCKN